MAIGEFGGAPAVPGSILTSTPLYWLYETSHAALSPARVLADATKLAFKNPFNPLYSTTFGKSIAAAAELFERSTRRYVQPDWRISSTLVGGARVPVHVTSVWERPFCRLLHFERVFEHIPRRPQPRLLIVAPLSGHYATLLRGTVEAFLPNHDVYITEWRDARTVPLAEGRFDLDDYIDYLISMFHALGGDTHVIAVCQPAVPVIAAVSVMEADGDPYVPTTMTLMGGPIDTRAKVPFPNAGFMRDVYPGFLQLNGFMSMNLDRHLQAHRDLFLHLVKGDGDSAQKHKEFYDEYLAVMDLPAEYYLQTVDTVFVRHALPDGEMMHRDRRVDPKQIKRVALLTVEGEHDDISGVGQTEAAQRLCSNIPGDRKSHWLQPGVGHYGVFNGSRFRAEIAPRIADFVLSMSHGQRARRNGGDASKTLKVEPEAGAAPAPDKRNGTTASYAGGKGTH
jgi:poly(3-hydroxybutyrate) depolymerase